MSAVGERPATGFTLLEMLVILAILALVTGIIFPSIDMAMRGQAFAASAVRIEGALRAARSGAIRGGRAVRFGATTDRHGFGQATAIERLPDTSFVTAPDGGIAFFADGSTTGGQITLVDGDRVRRWVVRPATGAIGRLR